MKTITIRKDETVKSLREKLVRDENEICKIFVKHDRTQLMLDSFRTNRSSAKSHIDHHVKKFLTGEFWKTGSLLHVDRKGRMANGEHRIRAQQIAGVDQEYNIMLGLTEPQVEALDEGVRPRKSKDRLKVSHTRLVRSIVGGEPGKAKAVASILGELYHVLTHDRDMDKYECMSMLRYSRLEMDWMVKEVVVSKLLNRVSFLLPTMLACRYARENDQWDEFVDAVTRLKSGENLSGILLAVREYLLSFHKRIQAHSGSTKRVQSRKPKDTRWVVLVKMLRAWQIFLSGEPYKQGKKKAKLNLVSDFSKLLEWFLEETREELVYRLKLRPVKKLEGP
jgi:hypothetical protein